MGEEQKDYPLMIKTSPFIVTTSKGKEAQLILAQQVTEHTKCYRYRCPECLTTLTITITKGGLIEMSEEPKTRELMVIRGYDKLTPQHRKQTIKTLKHFLSEYSDVRYELELVLKEVD